MEKIKKVVKLENLPKDGIRALLRKYPDGWEDHVRKITKPSGEFFHAIDIDTKEFSYLIKVDRKIDIHNAMDNLADSLVDEGAEKFARKDASGDSLDDLGDDIDDLDDDDDDDL
jgi:hypothetical protein